MAWRKAIGMRHQLWGLFGLFLLAGIAVLAIDEYTQMTTRTALEQLRDNSLQRLRHLKAVSDGYGLDVVDTTFRVRNGLMPWERGVDILDGARAKIDRSWTALRAMPRDPAQQALFDQVLDARVDADAAMGALHDILVRRDAEALSEFADTRLYPSIDPVTTRMEALSELGMQKSDALVREEIERGRRASTWRILLSIVAFGLALLLARFILRNAYRGVEALTSLARSMRSHQPDESEPAFRPRGELGDVQDAFLDMRRDVQRYESDLTGQLKVNEGVRTELERREEFQRSLLNAAQVAIMAMDGQGRWIMFNPFAEKMLGWKASEVLGRVPRYGMDPRPDDSPMLVQAQAVERIVAELEREIGEPMAADWRAMYALADLDRPPHEAALVHRDGHLVPVVLALASFRDAQDKPAGLIAVATDLTERKRLEEALRESEARAQEANLAKSSFLAAMSHEIRTPMIGVTGMVEILAHTAMDHDQRRALNVIQSSADALLQIIGDILDFSKIEAGRLELAPSPVDLRRVVRMAVANFGGSASSKGLALSCEIDDRVGPAYRADGLRVRQILSNFLSNAVKFTERGGVVVALEWIGAEPGAGPMGGDRLRLRVTDTGIGVSPEQQARLFQPFSQAESDTTRRFGGTGLGLAICRRLAELMGGQVAMDSAPGQGTTMRLDVAFPRAPASEVPSEAVQAIATTLTPRKLPTTEEAEAERSLVLLVDDHPTNRAVIARQLALAGYANETADEGEAGLLRWRTGRYALVLTDVHMPKLDGYQLAAAIREEEARAGKPRTPIIALTASALKGEAERCLAAGMDDYLAKPVGIPALVEMLGRWLPHTRADAAPALDLAAMLPQAERPPPLDEAVLAGLTHGDAVDTRALLDDFLSSTRGDLATLEAARDSGDLAAVTREAHKIKGAARSIGAGELGAAADALETAGRAQESALVPALATDLATAMQRLGLWVDARWPR